MDQHESIGIPKGRITGDGMEKIFFGDSRVQIQHFWGVNNLREFETRDHIVLPTSAQQYASEKLAETQQDGYEREAIFGWNDGKLKISYEGKSEKSLRDFIEKDTFFDSITLESRMGTRGFLEYNYWSRFFSTPHPIYFHTHPNFGITDIKPVRLRFLDGTGLIVPPNIVSQAEDFEADMYSAADMEVNLHSNRFVNSSLLGTKNRLLYLVPTELSLQLGHSRLNFLPNEFQERVNPIKKAAMIHLFGIDITKRKSLGLGRGKYTQLYDQVESILRNASTLDELKIMRDQALVDIAKKAGYVVFASDSPMNPTLKRLEPTIL